MIKPKEYNSLPLLAGKAAPKWKQYLAKNKKKLEGMDLMVHALHDKYAAAIDCMQCARCCKELGPRIEEKDVERLAKALHMKYIDVMTQFIKMDEDGDKVFKSMPCPFLADDNYCSVYESRPKACRDYPHTDRKRFYQIFNLSVKNAETCPIVYEVLDGITQ